MNSVNIIGNLTRDPEVKFLPSGKAVAEAFIAINERWLDDSGNKQEKSIFVDVTFWGKTAENFVKFHSKGDPCVIEGRLAMDQWEDKATGQKRTKLKVTCERWHFSQGRKSDGVPTAGPGANERKAPVSHAAPKDPDLDNTTDDVPW